MGLLLHLLGLLWPRLLFLGPHYYFVGLWTIIPSILAQWSLLCCFLSLSLSYCWASSTIGSFCQKWASTVSYAYVYKMDIPNSKWPKHWTLITLAWSALWGFDFKIKMISNILFFRANIIFISPSSSTDWCLLVLSLYWCKSESRLVYSSFLWWLYVFISWIG